MAVARDPVSSDELSVPLLPEEINAVSALNRAVQDLVPPLKLYGETFPAEYAGALIDGTTAVIQFTDRIDQHEASIRAFFGPDAPIEVREVRYSWRELEEFVSLVEADHEWFETIGTRLYAAGPMEQPNAVRVRYEGGGEHVEPLIRAHFGEPGWLELEWYGPLPWTGPRGSLRIVVTDRQGRPLEVNCTPVSVDPAFASSYLPLSSGPDGTCEYEGVPSTEFDVGISFTNVADELVELNERVRVPTGGLRIVSFEVDR